MALPELVIFDWDGTLVDSIEPILAGFELAYARYGHPCPTVEELRATIGLPLAAAFEALTPGLPAATMVTFYRDYWFDPARPPSPWADGALELLDWLRGEKVVLAVATGKSRRGVDHELEALAVRHLFATTRSADDAAAKPHPEMLLQILDELDVPPARACMIGDSPLDLAMARSAEIPAYGVLGGVGSRETLQAAAPRAVVRRLDELRPLLLNHHR